MRGWTRRSVATPLALAAVLIGGTACLPFPASRVTPEGAMDNGRLQTLIEGLAEDIEGEAGYWSFTVASRQVIVVTDDAADRMRIMTPVAEDDGLTAEQVRTLLEANFDRALDARYALARGYVWSAFIHPLTALTEGEFVEGVHQVVTLADNYGTTYTSTDLVFQGGLN